MKKDGMGGEEEKDEEDDEKMKEVTRKNFQCILLAHCST